MENSKPYTGNENLIQFLVEHSSQPFATAGPDGKIYLSNKACCDMLGYTEDELKAMDWGVNLTPPKWNLIESENLSELHRTGKPVRYEKEFICKNGSIIPVELLVHLVKDTSGTVIQYYTFVTDLTERRNAEIILKQTIREKEILMKELQHRVKNNLHIVAGLIDLEMVKLTDQKARDVFINAKIRINSMSYIYEQLYKTEQVDQIDLYDYISNLTRSLSETYIADPGKITIVSELEHIMMDLRRTVPLGLILNELILNAIKHAYSGDTSGKIRISLKKQNNEIVLGVSDNGAGLPEGFTIENNSDMGLTLVSLLTEQIRGEINVINDKGTSFIISFKS